MDLTKKLSTQRCWNNYERSFFFLHWKRLWWNLCSVCFCKKRLKWWILCNRMIWILLLSADSCGKSASNIRKRYVYMHCFYICKYIFLSVVYKYVYWNMYYVYVFICFSLHPKQKHCNIQDDAVFFVCQRCIYARGLMS